MKKGPLTGEDFEWTLAATETLRRLWSAGYDSGEIAAVLGCTKNAVVGKRNRMQLPTRKDGVRQAKSDVTPYRRLPEPPRFQVPPIEERPGWPTRQQLMAGR